MTAHATFARLMASSTARKFGLLVSGQGIGTFLSFALTVLIARGLSVEEFGVFRYAMTFLALGMTMLQFGAPYSVARILAIGSDRVAEKEIIGASAVIVAIGAAAGVLLTLFIDLGAGALGYEFPTLLLWISPALFLTLSQAMIGSICQGTNRIALLSQQQVLPYLILVPATAIQIILIHHYSLAAALVGYIVTFSIVTLVCYVQLGASLKNWRKRVGVIVRENRSTGLPIYVGGIFGVASVQLISMWTANYSSPVQYGQYTLAVGVSAPLGIFVSSVGTVIFRASSRAAVLSRDLLLFTAGLVLLLAISYFLATKYLLVWAFGSQYAPAVPMAQCLGIGSLLIGLGDIFQRFLGAHGLGRRLGAASVCVGVVGITVAGLLMSHWSVYGAIVASVAAGIAYLVLMIVLYRFHTRRLKRTGWSASVSARGGL
jgi:O-antigen/teichoic acid export membrane protein